MAARTVVNGSSSGFGLDSWSFGSMAPEISVIVGVEHFARISLLSRSRRNPFSCSAPAREAAVVAQPVTLDGLEDRSPRGIAGAFSRADPRRRAGPGRPAAHGPRRRRRPGRLPRHRERGLAGAAPHRPRRSPAGAPAPSCARAARSGSARAQRGLVGAGGPGLDVLRFDLSRGTPDPALLPSLGAGAGPGVVAGRHLGLPGGAGAAGARRGARGAPGPTSPETVTVVDGATDGVTRTLEELVSFGDRVVLESPGFPPFLRPRSTRSAPRSCRWSSTADGVRPDSLRAALLTRPVAVVLQPRAHNPTGISMTPARAAPWQACSRRARSGSRGRRAGRDRGRPLRRHQRLTRRLARQPTCPTGSCTCAASPSRTAPTCASPPSAARPRSSTGSSPAGCSAPAGPRGCCSRSCSTCSPTSQSMDEVAEARRQYFGRQRDLVDPPRVVRRRRGAARRHQPLAAGRTTSGPPCCTWPRSASGSRPGRRSWPRDRSRPRTSG